VHGEGGGGGGFAVEVAGGGEVVEGGFEGYFVVGSVGGGRGSVTTLRGWWSFWRGLTLRNVVGLRGRGS